MDGYRPASATDCCPFRCGSSCSSPSPGSSPPDSQSDRGGSGGIFGPGMVIGAFLGASVWRLFEPIAPSMGHDPAPYVIVGMMCCFGSISRAPLAVMLMVAEMTGSLSILAPAMIAVGLAWFIVRRSDDTVYRSQLKN